jgi:hypothetical protein
MLGASQEYALAHTVTRSVPRRPAAAHVLAHHPLSRSALHGPRQTGTYQIPAASGLGQPCRPRAWPHADQPVLARHRRSRLLARAGAISAGLCAAAVGEWITLSGQRQTRMGCATAPATSARRPPVDMGTRSPRASPAVSRLSAYLIAAKCGRLPGLAEHCADGARCTSCRRPPVRRGWRQIRGARAWRAQRGRCRQRRHGPVRPGRPAGEPSRRRVAA